MQKHSSWIKKFLPKSCIVEIIQEQNSEISSRDIRKDYTKLLSIMPENGNISFVVICMREDNMFQKFFVLLYQMSIGMKSLMWNNLIKIRC